MATEYDKELDSIREDLDDLHDNKVDVVKGKQLSTNDFTDEHLRKVNRIETKEYQQEIVAGVAKELERTNDNHVRLADEFHRHLYGQDGVDAKFKKEIQDNLNYMSGLVKSANDRMNEIWQNWDEIVKEDQNHELRLQQVEGKTLTHDALIDSNTSEILNIQGEQVIQNNQIKEMQDKNVELETRVVDVEVSDADQNHRLDIAENRIGTFTDRMTALEDGYAQRDARMDGLDAQVSRYTERMLALELNEKAQNDRIKAEEEKNKRQDIDIACLYAEAKDRTITLDTEGVAVELQNSREGFVTINSLEGNTMVNCNKDVDKEMTLLTSIVDVSADNNVTLTEGVVDDGLVDVYLEGNTLVNVSKTKDDYITPSIEDKIDKGSVISLPEVSEGYVNIDSVEGNTLVNYCTDGAKELTLNGDIDVEGTFVTTTEGVDNGLVDVALEGNTLVNLMYKGTNTGGNSGTHYVNTSSATLKDFVSRIKTSTTYTIIIYNAPEEVFRVFLGGCISELEVKPNVFILTTGENKVVAEPFHFYARNGEIPSDILSGIKIAILEGDYTDKPIPPYFEGMKSVGQDDENGHKIEISSRTKNLLTPDKINKWGEELHIEYSGTVEKYVECSNIPFKVKPNTTYTFSALMKATPNLVSSEIYALEYKKDSNTFYRPTYRLVETHSILEYTRVSYTFTTSSKTDRIQLRFDNNGSTDGNPATLSCKEFSLTLGNDSIYEVAKSNKKEILLNEPLRGLPNGVKDRFVKIGGKWYIERNTIEERVLDTWGWVKSTGGEDFYWCIDDKFKFDGNQINVLCDKLKSVTTVQSNTQDFFTNNYDYIALGTHIDNGSIAIDLNPNTLVNKTLEGFKEYIRNNAINIIYPLQTPVYEPLEIEPTLNTYNEVTHLSNNSIIPCNMQIKNTGYNAIIKPSTLYTVAVDTDKSGTIGINLGGAEVTTTNNVATITTPETLTDDSLRLHGKGIKASKVRLLEGAKTNWIPSFFEGMKSSFEDKVQEDASYKMEIISNNENLIDIVNNSWETIGSVGLIEKVDSDIIFDCNGSTTDAYGVKMSGYMYLKPNTQYEFNADWEILRGNTDYQSPYLRIFLPTANMYTGDRNSEGMIFTTDAIGIIRPMLYIDTPSRNDIKVKFTNIQLKEVGNTNYIPHKSNKIQLSSIEPLRGVGDVHDRLVFKDGKLMIERNCKEVVLDGSETWKGITDTSSIDGGGTVIYAGTDIPDGYVNHNKITVTCDKLSAIPGNFYNYYQESIYGYKTSLYTRIYIHLQKCKLNTIDSDGLKTWLQANPLIVTYQLDTPVYGEIPYDLQKIILESYDNGTLFIDTNIPPTKVSFNCFEEELTYLYPATSYTVQFVSDRAITADITLGGTSLLAQNIVKGLNRISITTPSELVDNKLIISGAGAKISEVVVTDTNRKFGYFEGMKSVGEGGTLEITSANGDNSLSNTQQLTHEPLRGVGDVKDRYVLIDGKWYIERNCGEVVLDGSDDEGWWETTKYAGTKENTVSFRVLHITSKRNSKVKSNIFKTNEYVWAQDIESCGTVENNNLDIRVSKNRLSKYDGATNTLKLVQYLQQNPLEIVYQLATPTYEPIDYNPFEVYSDTTHISANSTIPCNVTVKNHGYNCILKPSTTYTVVSNQGVQNMTTPATLGDSLRFSGNGLLKDVMILEGTLSDNQIPGFFAGMESCYEQKKITDEHDEHFGYYEILMRVNTESGKESVIKFYIKDPLRGIGEVKDKVFIKDDKVVVQRNCGVRAYEDGDFGIYITDKVNTVYPLEEPTYEEAVYSGIRLSQNIWEKSTLFFDTNIPSTANISYSVSTPILDQVAEVSSITDDQDALIIDMATQLAVLNMTM